MNGRFSGGGPGSKLAVRADGEVAGVLPQAVTSEVVRMAVALLSGGGRARLVELGGGFEVWVEPYVPGRVDEVAAAGGRAACVTLVAGGFAGSRLVVEADGRRTGTLGAPELDDEAARLGEELMWQEKAERRGTMFIDVVVPAPQLWVVGAGRIAGSLSRIGSATGWRVVVIDPAGGEGVLAASFEEAVAQLGGIDRATSIVVLSHDRSVDVPALAVALRSPARFVGAMGSRRTQAARREGLTELGVDASDWERVSAPVGLDLGAVNEEETALSILAEVVAARHGAAGGRAALRVGGAAVSA